MGELGSANPAQGRRCLISWACLGPTHPQRKGSESHSDDPKGLLVARPSPGCSWSGAAQSHDLLRAGPEASVRWGHVAVPGQPRACASVPDATGLKGPPPAMPVPPRGDSAGKTVQLGNTEG